MESEIEGSTDHRSLRNFARANFQMSGIAIDRKLPADWSVKVGGSEYGEEWLKHYAALRHFHGCVVMCSDYANIATGSKKPIVRDLNTDIKLLSAHADMMKASGQKMVRKGRE